MCIVLAGHWHARGRVRVAPRQTDDEALFQADQVVTYSDGVIPHLSHNRGTTAAKGPRTGSASFPATKAAT